MSEVISEGAVETAPSSINKKGKDSEIRYKDITVRAARNFTVLPKLVRNETRTRIGAFSLPGDILAYRCLSDKEITQFGGSIVGAIPGEPGFVKISNEFFNNYNVVVTYDEDVKLKVPTDRQGKVVLNETTRTSISDIMRYRHVTNCPRVAADFARYEEATHLYVAYIVDKRVIRDGNVTLKELRKRGDRLYLQLVDNKTETKLNMVLELLRRGVKTTNTKDLSSGYIPISLIGVMDVTSMVRDDKELAIEEFKLARVREFVEIMEDPDLEWKALLERAITAKVFARKGNVIMYNHDVVGSNDEETIARLKSPAFSSDLVVVKSQLRNAFIIKQ